MNRLTVGDISKFIDSVAPTKTALPFDNVGLLVGDSKALVTKILLALDITKGAINAAIASGCNLIVCHHPVIYKKLASITTQSIVYDLIRADISVISAHTNLDLAVDGVNHALAKRLALTDIAPFMNQDNAGLLGTLPTAMSPYALALHIKKSISAPVVSYVGGDMQGEIQRVAILGGAGEDYLYDSRVVDAYITGEVPHHIYCYAQNAGIRLFTAGHYATEVVVLPALQAQLQKNFNEVEIIVYSESGINYL